ncbi:MAG: hypothetical protein QXJ22_00260 [Ignisphaera sp.]
MASTSPSRSELIDIITSNNIIEEFVAWLRNVKKIDTDPISLKDVDYNLLLEFVHTKGLLKSEAPPELINPSDDKLEHYSVSGKRFTKPKKIRRKT